MGNDILNICQYSLDIFIVDLHTGYVLREFNVVTKGKSVEMRQQIVDVH